MGKGRTEKTVLKALEKRPTSRRELKRLLKAKHIKSTLRHLCEQGDIKKDGDNYVLLAVHGGKETSERQGLPAVKSQANEMPIAMQMRKEATKSNHVTISLPQEDIDDEIRRLEAELEQSSSSEESSEEDGEPSDGEGVLSLSEFAKDRISSLPAAALPVAGRYNPKDGLKASKKKRSQGKATDYTVSPGLKEAVKEVLSGYRARSSERLPFYCRVCSEQYETETEFFNHKDTQFHKTAVDMERKASYCKLCRKQLTSPTQMKEHLSSRPHRERLHKMKDRQSGRKKQTSDSRKQWT